MKKPYPREFVFHVASLLLSMVLVHGFYVLVVRPEAEQVLAEQTVRMQTEPDYVQERSVWVIIRDFEQEACFVLMFWAFAIMGYKASAAMRERSLLQSDLVPIAEGMRILPEDTREYARQIQQLPEEQRRLLLPRALVSALQRFGATRNVQDVSSSTHTLVASEAERLESELSMVRYIAWAIPSIGFIGTVRGIGAALALAHRAVDGDISGVTQSLGVAFNSTFIALIISIVVMFLVHQLQLAQERYVLDAEAYCEDRLIRHLHTG